MFRDAGHADVLWQRWCARLAAKPKYRAFVTDEEESRIEFNPTGMFVLYMTILKRKREKTVVRSAPLRQPNRFRRRRRIEAEPESVV